MSTDEGITSRDESGRGDYCRTTSVGGRASADVASLLFDGETVLARLSAGGNSLVATTHRVLAFTPKSSGANFAAVDRPNVEGVALGTTGRSSLLAPAARGLVFGGVLLGAGATVSFDGLLAEVTLSDGAAASVGFGGLISLFETMRLVFALFDDVLLVAGTVALSVGVLLVGVYLRSRERTVVVGVAGDEDLSVPAAEVTEEELTAFRTTFRTPDEEATVEANVVGSTSLRLDD